MTAKRKTDELYSQTLAFLSIFLKKSLTSLIYTILWLPVYLYRCILVEYVRNFKPSYGRIMNHLEAAMEEELYDHNPKVSLVFTLVLDKPLELVKLRKLFTENVLEAKITPKTKKTGHEKSHPRYPELKQYLTSFGGYKFYKNDETFDISNHVTEQPFSEEFKEEAKIHRDMTNKKYFPKRSPWELILVNNYYQHESEKALIIFRTHHAFADAKSCLKLLVECLGQKRLKMPNPQFRNVSVYDSILYYILLPFQFAYIPTLNFYANLKSEKCPWKWRKESDDGLVNIAISKEFTLEDVKEIAKRNNVTGSAVIMAAVVGGIRKCEKRLGKTDLPAKWIMPKPNHPDNLANHAYSAAMHLPTDIVSPLERLKKCNEIFLGLKNSNHYVYEKSILFQLGTWFSPLRRKMTRNRVYPIVVTNVASDSEGFQIGSSSCTDLLMTCGPVPSSFGVMIGTFSYKDMVKVWTSTKDEIFNEEQTLQIANLVEKEFDVLKTSMK